MYSASVSAQDICLPIYMYILILMYIDMPQF